MVIVPRLFQLISVILYKTLTDILLYFSINNFFFQMIDETGNSDWITNSAFAFTPKYDRCN